MKSSSHHEGEPRMLGCFSIFLLTGLVLLVGNIFLTPTYIAEAIVGAAILLLIVPRTIQLLRQIKHRRKRRRKAG